MFAVAWAGVERLSGAASAVFAGCALLVLSWHAVQVEKISSVLCEVPDHKRIDTHLRRSPLASGRERVQGCIGRIDSRTRMGTTASSSESGRRRPIGTARSNINLAFKMPQDHAASSVIS